MSAPKVTMADIEAQIAETHFFTGWEGAQFAFWLKASEIPDDLALDEYVQSEPHRDGPLGRITICVLVLRNGFTAVGVNEGPAHPDNFNAALGRQYAREKALDKVWTVLGYELKSRLAAEESKQAEVVL